MAYEDEEKKRTRVVVETPTARRESVHESSRTPDRGMSGGMVAAIVVGAVALVVILFLLFMNKQNDDAANMNARVANMQPSPLPQTTIIQQPAAPAPQQAPVIVQAPAASQPAPVVISPPASSAATAADGAAKSNVPDDSSIQANIDRKISASPTLSAAGVTSSVVNGTVTLTGTVESADLKRQMVSLVRGVRGVHGVEDHIVVSGGAQSSANSTVP